jgi:hypothetical protein
LGENIRLVLFHSESWEIVEHSPVREQRRTVRNCDQYAALHVALVVHTDVTATNREIACVARVMVMDSSRIVNPVSKMIKFKRDVTKGIHQKLFRRFRVG